MAASEALDREVREALIREARERILHDGPLAELTHVALMGVVTVLAYQFVPELLLGVWVLTISALGVTRMGFRHRLQGTVYNLAARRIFRALVIALALTWGLGFALFAHWLRFRDNALFLVVLAGLVSAGTVTLTADRLAYRLYLAAMMVPAFFGGLLALHDTTRIAAVLLIVLFSVGELLVQNRAYGAVLRQVRTAVQLTESERTATSERARLEALLASAPVAIVVVDDEGLVRDVNPEFESLFGYTALEARGRAINDLLVPPGELGAAADLDRKVAAGERVTLESQRRRKDGQLVPVRISAARVEDVADGAAARDQFVMYEDMTEQLRARRALEEAKDAAERLAQMRSAFLANMSHEIRTPMNAILGLTELLLDGELTAEQRRSLGLIQVSGEALLALLNDILDLSKIEADSLHLEKIPFDLWRVVDTTVALLAIKAREKHIELLTDIPADVPEHVRGDPTRLRQVLTNLIGNAVKFTHEGEVVVAMSGAPAEDGMARVRFAVKDTGIGISKEQLERIFQPFSQGDLSMARRYGGTGLGLTIAQRLVGMMGGKLEVKSEPKKGSEFFFTLYLEADTALQAPFPGAAVVPLKGRRMLVVDDNGSNRRIVRGMLSAVGVVVDEAEDAEAGLEALRKAAAAGTPYELAILDAQMPRTDGFQLAAQVRDDAQLQRMRLVMLTSAGQRGDAQRCRELGIRGYLTKPASRADLLDMVAGVLGAPETETPEVVTRHRIHESRRRLRVLLAEDNAVNQEVAATMLRRRGHDVDVVENGRLAWEAAGAARYDVVLMDIEMPEMDGYEAADRIRALPGCRDLPIVALTAHVLANEREKSLAHGMNAYLSKPFKAFELFAATEGWGARPPAAAASPPPMDLDGFRREMEEAGAGEAVDEIVASFALNLGQRVRDIAAAVGAGDAKAVARLAHAVKSSAAQLGAARLAELLKSLETAAKAEPPGDLTVPSEALRREAAAVAEYLAKK